MSRLRISDENPQGPHEPQLQPRRPGGRRTDPYGLDADCAKRSTVRAILPKPAQDLASSGGDSHPERGTDRMAGATFNEPKRKKPSLAANVFAGGAANILKIGLQFVMLPLMAHLLGPSEFGIYALALPTISFVMILADGGLAASLARETRNATLVWSTAFWLVMMLGIVLAAFVVGSGFVLASVSNEPRVNGLMSLLSLSVIMVAASALPSANLTRQGRLVTMASSDLVSALAGASVAVVLAMSGAGAKSLAAQYVTYYAIRAVILNISAFVRPTFQFKLSAVYGHLSTGSAVLGMRLVDFSGRLAENVLYGRAFGASGLGMYTFANQAPRFLTEAASNPTWAALYSHALHEDRPRVEVTHANLVRLLATVVFPAAALLSATAPGILGALLGPKWDAASTLLRILIPFYALGVVSGLSGAILIARGQGWLTFWIGLFLTVGRTAAVAAGPWIGQIGVAVAIGIVLTIYSIIMFESPRNRADGRRFALIIDLAPPSLASLVAGLFCYELSSWVEGGLILITGCWVISGVLYLAVLFALRPRTGLADFEKLRNLAFRWKGRQES